MNVEDSRRVYATIDFGGRIDIVNIVAVDDVFENHVKQTLRSRFRTFYNTLSQSLGLTAGRDQRTGETVSDGHREDEKKSRITDTKWKVKRHLFSGVHVFGRRSRQNVIIEIQKEFRQSKNFDSIAQKGRL